MSKRFGLRFSQRKGYKPVQAIIQRSGMSDELRNSLWNVLDVRWLHPFTSDMPRLERYTYTLWFEYFKLPIDALPNGRSMWYDAREEIRNYLFRCAWFEVYDFLEFTLGHFEDERLNREINYVLERELSGFRVVGNVVTDITDEQEVEAIETALQDYEFPSVRAHLQKALELLSDRENPDYRNSIKESISAVEGIAKMIAKMPKANLSDALGKLELHKALREGFLKLYGYTSDADGIRHAMLDEPKLSAAEARYFLVSCSAFVNYLKSKLN